MRENWILVFFYTSRKLKVNSHIKKIRGERGTSTNKAHVLQTGCWVWTPSLHSPQTPHRRFEGHWDTNTWRSSEHSSHSVLRDDSWQCSGDKTQAIFMEDKHLAHYTISPSPSCLLFPQPFTYMLLVNAKLASTYFLLLNKHLPTRNGKNNDQVPPFHMFFQSFTYLTQH